MEDLDARADGCVVPATRGAMRQVAGKTPQLPGGRYDPIPKVGMSLQELVTPHVGNVLPRPRGSSVAGVENGRF